MRYIPLLTLPATLAHEAVHAAVGAPWARRIGIVVEPGTGAAHAQIDWRDGAHWIGPVLASLAPFLAGCIGGVAILAFWVGGGLDPPQSAVGIAKLTIVAMWWSVFAYPSRADLATARKHLTTKEKNR